jgi:hypothetical protein
MSKDFDSRSEPVEPAGYQIRLKGHLEPAWSDWFGGLAMQWEEDGATVLTVSNCDQAALHGLLRKVRDSGMVLLSINPLHLQQTEGDTR